MDIGTLLDFTGIRYLWNKISPFMAEEYASKADVESIASMAGSGFTFKGAVTDVTDLPDSGNEVGDMYSVTAAAEDGGGNYAWDGTAWALLAPAMDTSQYALDADVVHNTGAETVAGVKTFSDGIVGDLAGTASMATADASGNVIDETYATKDVATDSVSGLMSAADKSKLDGIQSGATAFVLGQAAYGTLGGVTTTESSTDTAGMSACPIVSGVPYFPSAIADADIDALFA